MGVDQQASQASFGQHLDLRMLNSVLLSSVHVRISVVPGGSFLIFKSYAQEAVHGWQQVAGLLLREHTKECSQQVFFFLEFLSM
jgi:hypothetical protein